MSRRYLGGFISVTNNPLLQLGAPTAVTAAPWDTQATVTFTPPIVGTPTSYTVVSSPGGIVATGSASPITVSGLTNGTAYTFTVYANNQYGPGTPSAPSNSVTPIVPSQAAYTTAGTYSWTAPANVYSVSVVAVGGGGGGTGGNNGGNGGGGGGLGWKNNIAVTPGNSYTVVVGAANGESYFINNTTVAGLAGGNATSGTANTANGGGYVGDGGGNGGRGSRNTSLSATGGGGGAGGYTGNGGQANAGNQAGSNGAGGGGGGGGGAGSGATAGSGGGVGLLGQGASGAGGSTASGGKGGSGGGDANNAPFSSSNKTTPGNYGGGAGGSDNPNGEIGPAAGGAVRIIWPGASRLFPSTNTVDF